jgi:hypothetical protein
MGPDLGDATFGENAQFKHGRGLGAFKQKQEITIQMQGAKGTFSQAPFFFFLSSKALARRSTWQKMAERETQPTEDNYFRSVRKFKIMWIAQSS